MYKDSKNILSIRSPVSSSKNRINNANTKNTTPFSNSENLNYNSNENRVEKINQSSFAKISHKNKYISIGRIFDGCVKLGRKIAFKNL